MAEKTFKIVGNDMSDGYHTFDELYQHRVALFLYALRRGAFTNAYAVKDHFEGWDLIVAYTCGGSGLDQISYHVPATERPRWEDVVLSVPKEDHQWDGHTSAEVVNRLNRMD